MAQISLRVDDDVKRNAERTLTDIGLSMSTAINIFLKKVARENRIPFELSADPFYSQENMDELERRVANVRAGKSTLKRARAYRGAMMRKLWHDEAWEEYLYWQSQDKKTLKKINRLLTDIDRNGYQCTGKPEPLGENLAGYWSVRIDEKNRIVFQIDGNDLEILQCGTHYKDK